MPLIKHFAIGSLCALAGFIVSLVMLINSISAPQATPLEEYHKSWLHTPEQHAILYKVKHGDIPYLVIEPFGVTPSARGKVLRQQLEERGENLPPFGKMNQHIILLHGRKSRKENLLPIAERYCAVGYRCIIPDLPSHGENLMKRGYFGSDEREQRLLKNMIVTEEERLAFPKKATIWGLSMGGSYATQLVGAKPNLFEKCILISTFDTLENVINKRCTQQWLTSLALKISKTFLGFDMRQVNSIEALSHSSIPLFVAHGENDKTIPCIMGKRLYESSPSKDKQLVVLLGANHKNIFITEHPLHADIVSFIRKSGGSES